MGKTASFSQALIRLDAWFGANARVLPWRDDPKVYRVWISEIMLQQTQVATVLPYFERFLKSFPSVETLANASEDQVLLNWAGLGYYSRARNVHKAAKKIAAEGFPRDREGWLEIPGVGDYTAGAILSIAFDLPEAILDGNVERVISRLRRVNRRGPGEKASDAAYKRRLWRLSRAFVERGHALGLKPSRINQALMELGATVCSPRNPKCGACPLSAICRARAEGDAEAYPPKKPRKEWIAVDEEVHCLVDAEGRWLLQKRLPGEWRAGLWDFPLKAPQGTRGLEKLGTVENRYVVTRHRVSRRTQVWKSRAESKLWRVAQGMPEGSQNLLWVRSNEEVPVGSALRKTLKAIEAELPGTLGSTP